MRQIGRYEVIRELGRGAMGVVWEARDPLIRRVVAIKTIETQTLESSSGEGPPEDLLGKVLREARAVGVLSHPGIVVVHDVGQAEDFAYIAMEHVQGPTLREAISVRMPPRRVVQILRQIAEALDYAHQKGVVHRDIKPGNIMLANGSVVKITDFGLAKLANSQSQTQSALQGTPSYMAPEQINSQPTDGRADQFSLAVMSFEMLTGKRPFLADSMWAVIQKILTADPPAVESIAPELSPALNKIFKRVMAKAPENRYRTCSEFVSALDEALDLPTDPDATGTLRPVLDIRETSDAVPQQRARNTVRLRSVFIAAAITAVVIGGSFALRALWSRQPPASRVSAEAPLSGVPAAQIDLQFDAMPASIDAGQSVTLSWDVKGAAEVVIDGLGKVSDTGRRIVFPAQSVVYWLTASRGDQRKTASVEIVVRRSASAATARNVPDKERLRSPSPPASTPSPPPVEKPATPQTGISIRESEATSPTEGRIVWTGPLEPGAQLTIVGSTASTGTLSSTLPEGATIEGVSPASIKTVRRTARELVLQNVGSITETFITIRWILRK